MTDIRMKWFICTAGWKIPDRQPCERKKSPSIKNGSTGILYPFYIVNSNIKWVNMKNCYVTVCPRSSDPFYVYGNLLNKNWVTLLVGHFISFSLHTDPASLKSLDTDSFPCLANLGPPSSPQSSVSLEVSWSPAILNIVDSESQRLHLC